MKKKAERKTNSNRMTAAERKLDIVRQSSRLFAKKGLHGVTTKEIAAACGVSEPVLYQHFATKEDLYLELQTLCRGYTLAIKHILEARKPSTETLCVFVYILASLIVIGHLPGNPVLGEPQVFTRLAGFSLLEDGHFVKILMRDCIGSLMDDWLINYKAALKSRDLEISKVDGKELWMVYENCCGMALFNLNGKELIPQLHHSDDFLDKMVLFNLRGLGVKESAIKKYYRPKKWIPELKPFYKIKL